MNEELNLALKQSVIAIIVIFLSIIVGGFVTHLLAYHIVVIAWQGMTTYESKKDHFKGYAGSRNPYQAGRNRCYLLCRRKVNKVYSLRGDQVGQVGADSDRRCSIKIVTRKTFKNKVNIVAKYQKSKKVENSISSSLLTTQECYQQNQINTTCEPSSSISV